METLDFDLAAARQFLTCIVDNQPVPVPADGWSKSSALMLAGACLYAHTREASTVGEQSAAEPEESEADQTTVLNDLSAAIRYCRWLLAKCEAGEYDAVYEPRIVAAISQTHDPAVATVEVTEGRRELPENESSAA